MRYVSNLINEHYYYYYFVLVAHATAKRLLTLLSIFGWEIRPNVPFQHKNRFIGEKVLVEI